MTNCRIKGGFTLAEVLLTLTIVGIVATLTIPALIQDIQYRRHKTAFKAFYSDFSQVAQRVIINEGGNIAGMFPGAATTTYESYLAKFSQYFNTVKSCDYYGSLGVCWPEKTYRLAGGLETIYDTPAIIINNGVMLKLDSKADNCYPQCSTFLVDVNGFKGPNQQGRDVFYIVVFAKSIQPQGADDDGEDCDPSWGHGEDCAYKVLMNQDY